MAGSRSTPRAPWFPSLTVAARTVAAIAVATCLLVGSLYAFGHHLEQEEQRELWSPASSSTDPLAIRPTAPVLAAAAQATSFPAAAGAPQPPEPATANLPAWVQAARQTRLWDSPLSGDEIATIGQWQYLRVLAVEGKRFRVEYADRDETTRAGWVDFDDVGLAAAPPTWVRTIRETWLFGSPDGADSTMIILSASSLMVAGEGRGARLFVYFPVEPTARRTGFGWVYLDAVEPTAPPRGIALPSPSFRAVPLARPGVYRVQPGDTLDSIAASFSISPQELARLNDLEGTGRLLVGQILRAPRSPNSEAAAAPQKVREISPGWVSAEYAVVVDEASGEVLWSHNPNVPVAPASLTKTMTALVVLDHANLTDPVRVRIDSRRMPGSTVMGLYPGEELTVEDLLYGLMLPSGNDAALALAEHVAGTREAFADLMNEKVRALGLTGSHFVNPHGLDAAGHVSTPYDMAMIAREGMTNPVFRALAAAKTYQTPHGRGYQVGNLNRLLWSYPGADGVKIGFTTAAGRAIVGSATRDGHRVYVAMMRSNDIYADSTALLNWAFNSYTWP